MALLDRLKVTFKALAAPADDPREMYGEGLDRQRTLLTKVQHALVDIAAAKSRLQAKTAEVRDKLPALQERAKRCLQAGQEDLARTALQQRQVAIVMLDALETQVRELEQEEQRLVVVEQCLSARVEAFFTRQVVIMARYSAAEAQVRINESLSGVSQELADLGAALEQAEQKTDHMQARASAIDQLVEMGALDMPVVSSSDTVERELAQLDTAKAVDDQLAALKKEIVSDGRPPR